MCIRLEGVSLLVLRFFSITILRLANRWRSGSRTDGQSGKNTTPWRPRNPQIRLQLPPLQHRQDSVAEVDWPSVRQRPQPAPSFSARATTTRRWKTRKAATVVWTRQSPRWLWPGRPSHCHPRLRRRITRPRPRPQQRQPWPGRPVRGKTSVVFLKIYINVTMYDQILYLTNGSLYWIYNIVFVILVFFF